VLAQREREKAARFGREDRENKEAAQVSSARLLLF
jgi:hypothetical protein